MQKTDTMPMWVFLALSSVETRKTALMLTLFNIVFTAYCIPWVTLYSGVDWVAQLFFFEDWEWFAWSSPMSIWYWLSIKWVDKNRGWRTENAY